MEGEQNHTLETPPGKLCANGCKVGRCEVPSCNKCRRCGCNHDGITPSRATKRKRGGRGKSMAKKPRRVKSNKPGQYAESPFDPHPFARQAKDTFVLHSSFATPNPAVTTSTSTVCATIGDVLRAFGLSDEVLSAYAHIPSLANRQDPATWKQPGESSVRRTQKLLREIVRRVCLIFCANNIDAGDELVDSVLRRQPQEVSANDSKLTHTVGSCYAKALKGSIEKRVLRACLTHFPRSQMEQLGQAIPGFTLSSNSFCLACQDLQSLRSGEVLMKSKRTVMRYSGEALRQAVEWILSGANVVFLSWGTKRIKLDGRWQYLPAIMRKRSQTRIYEGYVASMTASETATSTPTTAETETATETSAVTTMGTAIAMETATETAIVTATAIDPAIETEKMLSRPTFFRITAAITAGGAQLRQAIDYVVGFLVHDPVTQLQRIITKSNLSEQEAEELLADLEAISAYLKYGFDYRVRNNNDCVMHHIENGLNPAFTGTCHTSVCDDCKKVFGFFEHLRIKLAEIGAPESATRIVADCCTKAKLFLGHRLRVLNQQDAIARIAEDMKERCLVNKESDEAIVILDFKMKLEPLYFREKTVDHYGKRGMSWHGAMVQFWEYEVGEEAPAAVDQKLYYDHISSGDTKQDRESVLSMLEAVLIRLRKDLPHVKKIVLQMDNAPCYQNMLLPVVVPLLSWAHGIEITRIIHTETQDGKSMLDAHFARAMRLLTEWVKEGNNCVTPTQAVIGLNSHGGLPNTVVELVEHNRDLLKPVMESVQQMEKELKKHISRANDIQLAFVDPTSRPDKRADNISQSRQCPPFSIKIFEYSGIGTGLTAYCSPERGTCVVHATTVANTEEDDAEDDETHVLDSNAHDEDHEPDDQDVDHDIYVEDAGSETIDMEVRIGVVTGVIIATQGQLRRRQVRRLGRRRAKKTPDELSMSHDAVAEAIRTALLMHTGGRLFVQDVSGQYPVHFGVAEMFPAHLIFPVGWAVRPKRGQMYGHRYIEGYREDIRELFERGVIDKANKMGPGRMLEELERKYPDRYDLPTENEIRQEISKLHQKNSATNAPRGGASELLSRDAAESTKKKEHSDFLHELVGSVPSTKPREALERFQDKFPASGLSDQQIKAKFQYVRTQMRRRQGG